MLVNFNLTSMNRANSPKIQKNRISDYNWVSKIPESNLKQDTISFTGGTTLIAREFRTLRELSLLESVRSKYKPKLPSSMKGKYKIIRRGKLFPTKNSEEIEKMFPNTYGQEILTFKKVPNSSHLGKDWLIPANKAVKNIEHAAIMNSEHKVAIVLSGGPAPGANAIIAGLLDANPKNKLYGFIGGPDGLIKGEHTLLDKETLNIYRNLGGFDLIDTGRGKIETPEQINAVLANCKELGIDKIIIIGGDDSNTNAAILAEKFKDEGISVLGAPKTIDGDLKNEYIETSFGFDSAAKTASATIAGISKDTISTRKYWRFVQLMGRSASHLTLEAALDTKPNVAIISEEIAKKGMSLNDVVNEITQSIVERSKIGKNYGVALIPEGLLEFIPEISALIKKLDVIIPKLDDTASKSSKIKSAEEMLDPEAAKLYSSLPTTIKEQFLMERDPHGNFPFSKIETHSFLIDMIKAKLNHLKKEGKYTSKFEAIDHKCGYDLRAVIPSNFDSDYCNTIGHVLSALINSGETGYIAGVKNLSENVNKWLPQAIPVTGLMNMEIRNGKAKPVIEKSLVDLDGPVFRKFAEKREEWRINDSYHFGGGVHIAGPKKLTGIKNNTLLLEHGITPSHLQ